MTETWCIENDFAAQRELAATEEARGFREIEKLRARLAESEARVKALEDSLRKAKYEKSIMDSAAIEDNEAYIQRLERAIKELISQDISEQYLNMVRKNTTAEELLEEERDSLRSKVKALEEALRKVRDRFFPLAQPERDRDILWDDVNEALEATCKK